MEISPLWLTIIFFVPLVIFLISGLPITFVLGGLAVLLTLLLMGPKGLPLIVYTAYAQSTEFVLIAIPLFVLMAFFLEHTGMADGLFSTASKWVGSFRGGLAASVVIVCAVFAAMAGISSVATLTMGVIALPAMMKRGYGKHLAIGVIGAGGALGILIPPSIIMILYGSVSEVSIGQLFIAGIIPGILLTAIFILYIWIKARLQPSMCPSTEQKISFKERFASLKQVILPILLIIFVIGVIYTGICTPTEAAGAGAFGAFICSVIYRKFNLRMLGEVLMKTLGLIGMVMWVMIGAVSFSHIYAISGITEWVTSFVHVLEISRYVVLVFIQLTFFIMGMFLDPAGIIMICTPIFVPLALSLGFDPLWFGILFVINMEMAYITPPFGFNLFYLKSIAPPDITMGDIYRSVWPFVGCQALCLALVIVFPQIALWLPSTMH